MERNSAEGIFAKEYNWIINLLIEMKMKGIPLFVNGIDYSHKEFAETCMVLEKDTYMAAYIGDDDGKVIQLHFDKVTMY